MEYYTPSQYSRVETQRNDLYQELIRVLKKSESFDKFYIAGNIQDAASDNQEV